MMPALDSWSRGSGPPLLLIQGVHPIAADAAFVEPLAGRRTVIAPSAPGFGASPRAPDCDTMYDVINAFRAAIDAVPPGPVDIIGFSWGGWIAAELAVAGCARLRRLVLVDPVGIKVGPRDQRDIAHFFNTHPEELLRRAWHDPAARPPGVHGLGWHATIDETMTDPEMVTLARNWDSLCLYAWTPHMFNPRLADWLHRIRVPTLVLWGDNDRIVTPAYGRAFADRIPGAVFDTIAEAGHHPEYEQPAAFAERVAAFLDGAA